MSFSGGTFSINTAGQPVVTGTVISSTAFNALTADLATGLSTCVLKNGTQTITANIPMGGFQFTGLAQNNANSHLTGVAGTNTVTGTATPTPTYAVGQRFTLVPAVTNTGATTLNISSVGAGAVQWAGAALTGGEFVAGTPVTVLVTAATPVFEIMGATQFPDTRALVVGGTDATKKLRFEVDGLTTATTRVVTIPDADLTLPTLATQGNVDAGTSTATFLAPSLNRITLSTEQASTSGTTIDFLSIPSGTRRITIMGQGVSTNGTSPIIAQLGDSGGIENAGYTGGIVETVAAGNAATNNSTGFLLHTAAEAAATYDFTVVLVLENSTSFRWLATITNSKASAEARCSFGGGAKATSAELDRVRITTAGGVNTFDAGVINIQYER